MSIYKELQRATKSALKKRSAADLARASGLDSAAILRFARGERDLTCKRADRLAVALGLSLKK